MCLFSTTGWHISLISCPAKPYAPWPQREGGRIERWGVSAWGGSGAVSCELIICLCRILKIIKEAHAMRNIQKSYSRSARDWDRSIKMKRNESMKSGQWTDTWQGTDLNQRSFCLDPQPLRSPTVARWPHTPPGTTWTPALHDTEPPSKPQTLQQQEPSGPPAWKEGKNWIIVIIQRLLPLRNKSRHKLRMSNTVLLLLYSGTVLFG